MATRVPSAGVLVLCIAWLVVLLGLGGVVGYAFLAPAPLDNPSVVRTPLPEPNGSRDSPETVGMNPAQSETADAGVENAAMESATRTDVTSTDEPAKGPDQSSPEAPENAAAAPPRAPAQIETIGQEAPATSGDTAGDNAQAPQQSATLPSAQPSAPDSGSTWERYALPFDLADTRPRIAVVISGLGLSQKATESAIRDMPSQVTLSFTPYAKKLQTWIAVARGQGHEVMLDLPMEPATFPKDDPGPHALITSLPPDENMRRLNWILDRGSAYVGLAGSMGSRFAVSREQMRPILATLKSRGLVYLDNRPTERSVAANLAGEIGLPRAVNNRLLDELQASRVAIDARLAQIERIALTEGYAVAMARPFPVTLERLAEWLRDLDERGFALAPLTAVVNRQPLY